MRMFFLLGISMKQFLRLRVADRFFYDSLTKRNQNVAFSLAVRSET